jgi:hypothetical protein
MYKLPYNSRWHEPFSCGVDCLSQDWRGFINYCNPPFCLLGRVLTLVERQQVAAAVVVPLGTKASWGHKMARGARGVVGRIRFRPSEAGLAMEGPGGLQASLFRGEFAIVFYDFRLPGAPRSQAATAEGIGLTGALARRRRHSHIFESARA